MLKLRHGLPHPARRAGAVSKCFALAAGPQKPRKTFSTCACIHTWGGPQRTRPGEGNGSVQGLEQGTRKEGPVPHPLAILLTACWPLKGPADYLLLNLLLFSRGPEQPSCQSILGKYITIR